MFDRFRAFSQKQQIMLITAVLAGSCVLFVTIWFFFLRTPYEPLFTNLRAGDAATIVSDLERRKVPYRLADGGATIFVPADKVENTRLKVMTEDLPLKGTVGFELFNKSDMGLTDFAQKINYLRALQGELERTIMSLDGVDAARVHVSLGEDRIFRENQVPPKASVTIRMARGARLDPKAVPGIQRLIAAAIPKLDEADVVVLDEEGRVISATSHPAPAEESLSPALEQKRAVEEYYAARVRQVIAQSSPSIAVSVDAVAATETLGSWTPASRTFPLHVKLSSVAQVDEGSRSALRNLVAGAVGVNPVGGDTVEVAVVAPIEQADAEAPVPAAKHPAAPRHTSVEENERSWSPELILALVPVLLLVGMFLLFRRARQPRRLTEEQRSEFVAKLQRALAQRQGHATP